MGTYIALGSTAGTQAVGFRADLPWLESDRLRYCAWPHGLGAPCYGLWMCVRKSRNRSFHSVLSALAVQPFADFPEILRLQASNGTPHIVFGGPYESTTAVVDMTECMSYVLEEQMKAELENARAITVLVDESTDRGRSHNLAVYVSYVGAGYHVHCRFLKLVKLGSSCDAATLESKLLDALKVCTVCRAGYCVALGRNLLEVLRFGLLLAWRSWPPTASTAAQGFNIDLTKVFGFTSDGASVMTGDNTGLAARMQLHNPFMLRCVCLAHKLALCVANVFATFPELVELDTTITTITTYFAFSSNRKNRLEELLEELEEPVLAVLQVHK